MSIESEGAKRIANSEGFQNANANVFNTFLANAALRRNRGGKGGKSRSGGGTGPGTTAAQAGMSAEDWENSNTFADLQAKRDQASKLLDHRIGQQTADNAMVRTETAANNDLKRHGARVQSYLQHANDNAGTGQSISNLEGTADGGFKVSFGSTPAPASATPPSESKTRSRQMKDVPPKPRTPRPNYYTHVVDGEVTGTTYRGDAPASALTSSSVTPAPAKAPASPKPARAPRTPKA
jgi:hypothetical protein